MNKIKTNTIILIVVGVLVAAIAWKVFGNANAATANGKKQNGSKKQNQGTSGNSGSSEAPADGDGAASSFFGRK